MRKTVGLYLHIPFCDAKCAYCDFYSAPANHDVKTAYTAALCRELTRWVRKQQLQFDTVYLGGGTPTLLGDDNLKTLLDAVMPYTVAGAEITCEANPASALENTLGVLADGGVNRVSIGLQSCHANELAALGRRHTAEDFSNAVQAAKRAGIKRISADVMLGIPQQTAQSLDETLAFVLSHGIQHVSAYLLKLEDGTPMAKSPPLLPDEDAVCDLYLQTCDTLRNAGLQRYEISNFAVSGQESRHNLRYWQCEEYLGLGPAAHSFLNGRRFYFPRDLQAFLTAPQYLDDGAGGTEQEKLMLGLRLRSGIDCRTLPNSSAAERLCKGGLLESDGKRIWLTDRGALVSNAIITDLICS